MHFHAEHSLFFESRRPLWKAGLSLTLTLGVLIVNAMASDITVSAIGSGVGALLLLIAYARGHQRIEPALAWTTLLIIFTLLGGVALRGDVMLFTEAATRISCGVLWILWLGTQMDWASLRQLLLTLRVPANVVAALDHAILHGVLTRQEWSRRRDTAFLRLGAARLPLKAWGQILGEGAMQGFVRLEHAEEHAVLRSADVVSEDQDNAVHLDAVQVARDEHVVLKQLDLKLGCGEWLLLCGPSGTGKSSLLRLLAGLDAPAEGSLNRLGVRISPDTPLKTRLDGRVALLSQNPEHHFIASTVVEDIEWGLLHRGVEASEARSRATEMAQALGIGELLERPCHALSFGEQRRVALAGLMVLKPSLLLLDEPTSGLDPVAAHELRALVEQTVRQTGAACIWATHDLDSVPPPAQRVVLLRDGQALFDGATDEGLSTHWRLRAGLAVPPNGE